MRIYIYYSDGQYSFVSHAALAVHQRPDWEAGYAKNSNADIPWYAYRLMLLVSRLNGYVQRYLGRLDNAWYQTQDKDGG